MDELTNNCLCCGMNLILCGGLVHLLRSIELLLMKIHPATAGPCFPNKRPLTHAHNLTSSLNIKAQGTKAHLYMGLF